MKSKGSPQVLSLIIKDKQIPSTVNTRKELQEWLRNKIGSTNCLLIPEMTSITLLKLHNNNKYREAILTFDNHPNVKTFLKVAEQKGLKANSISEEEKSQQISQLHQQWKSIKESNTIHVSNLSNKVDEESLHTIFSKWGEIMNMIILPDSQEPTCFIVYDSEEAAETAIQQSVLVYFTQPNGSLSQITVGPSKNISKAIKNNIQVASDYLNEAIKMNGSNPILQQRKNEMSISQIQVLYDDKNLLIEFIKSGQVPKPDDEVEDDDDNDEEEKDDEKEEEKDDEEEDEELTITVVSEEGKLSHDFAHNVTFEEIRQFYRERIRIRNYALAYKNQKSETVIIPNSWMRKRYLPHRKVIINDTFYVIPFNERFPENNSLYIPIHRILEAIEMQIKNAFQQNKITVSNIEFHITFTLVKFASSQDKNKALRLNVLQITDKVSPRIIQNDHPSDAFPKTTSIKLLYTAIKPMLIDQFFKSNGMKVKDQYIDLQRKAIYVAVNSPEDIEKAIGSIQFLRYQMWSSPIKINARPSQRTSENPSRNHSQKSSRKASRKHSRSSSP